MLWWRYFTKEKVIRKTEKRKKENEAIGLSLGAKRGFSFSVET